MRAFILLTSLLALGTADSYDGYSAFEVTVTTEKDANTLFKLSETLADTQLLEPALRSGRNATFIVGPTSQNLFRKRLDVVGIRDVHRVVDNVQKVIDAERDAIRQRQQQRLAEGKNSFDFNNFNRYKDIVNYLEDLKTQCQSSTVECEVRTFGESVENRLMYYNCNALKYRP